jgi:hypothetical protein
MWQIIGWVVWGIVAFLAISFARGCRSYAKSGQGFQWASGVQTFFWWLIAIIFLIFEWNKLHILWIAPISFFSAQFLVLGSVPILSPIILFATRMFLGIILIGIEKTEGLSTLYGGVNSDKIGLIKNLAKKRVQNDPIASMLGDIDSLSETMLMGLPEATIVTIVETWAILRKQGLRDKEILQRIEAHRASFGGYGDLPDPLTLQSYIKYRLDLEHGHGAPISEKFMDYAIEAAKKMFSK